MTRTGPIVFAALAAWLSTGVRPTCADADASAPVPTQVRPQAPPGPAPQNRRRGVAVMTLTGPWADGGAIPRKYTQAGDEVSPGLTWSGVPDGVTHFVLVAHDLDAAVGDGRDDVLHWLVWNIPGSATGVPEGVPQGPSRPDGSRQISVTGPNYRGPGAPAAGPAHHYVFELYALDAPITVADGQSPGDTRAAVLAAMSGHVRGKAVFTGLFKREG
jgi:Raf kinase inhibitor-like YbhB/YbcL family protein